MLAVKANMRPKVSQIASKFKEQRGMRGGEEKAILHDERKRDGERDGIVKMEKQFNSANAAGRFSTNKKIIMQVLKPEVYFWTGQSY